MSVIYFIVSLVDLQTLFILFVVFLLCYYIFTQPKLPPGPFGWPIIGNLPLMNKIKPGKRYLFYKEMYEKYGNICRIRFGVRNMFLISGYDMVHEALSNVGNGLDNRPNWLYTIEKSTKNGKGIIFANGKEWKDVRRMALITLRDFGVGKLTIEERILEEFQAVKEELLKVAGKPIRIKYFLIRAITNVICSILFGNRFDYNDPKYEGLVNALEEYFKTENTSSPINAIPWLRFLPGRKQNVSAMMAPIVLWSGFVSEQIKEHEDKFDKHDIKDFVDVYLKTRESADDKSIFTTGNIFRLIIDLFAAGTDTTANTMDWVFLHMIGYPDVLKKCQEEIDTVVGRGNVVHLIHRPNLPYVQATIQEIQRICNISPTTIPHGTVRDTSLGGYTLTKNSIVIMNLMSVHTDPKYWEDPDIFRPENFLDENGKLRRRKAFMPFGIGARECIGESLAKSELFLLFSNLINTFNFSRVNGHKVDFDGFHGKTFIPKQYELVVTPVSENQEVPLLVTA